MPSPRMNMSDKLRVLFDTTVFCGALVKPDGGNMRCLLLANAPFFDPVISQGVLAEFIHSATVRGLGHGRNRRLYHYEEVREFLEALAPLWDHAVPVGLRAVLPELQRWPRLPVDHALQNIAGHWPSTVEGRRLLDKKVAEIDPKDAHVMLVAQEHAADILVTSNVEDFAILTPACRVEPPSVFLRRWI